jgi:hypothetical protein
LIPDEIEEELHFDRPVFLTTRYAVLCFRMFSSARENGFVRALWRQLNDDNFAAGVHAFCDTSGVIRHAGSNRIVAGREHVRPDPYCLLGPRPARDAASQRIGWLWFNADRCREQRWHEVVARV